MTNSPAKPPAPPEADFSEFGSVTTKPLGRIQQLTARFLGRNWATIPHVTHHDEADITTFEDRRTAWNVAHPDAKLTTLVPLLKALAAALQAYPVFNTSLGSDGNTLVYKDYFHIGVAVDTPRGLLVPVLRDVDRKIVAELHSELGELSSKARSKGLSMAEMSGGCITLSSLGHIGGTAFTPIVNAPEVAILGVSRLQLRPAPAPDGGLSWRKMLPLSLSYDHRVINGADAARFVRAIAETLSAFEAFG
jgi:pyruvate dehydrogenase E2 component (dihydrolipoamide acetyltransferase)